MQLQAEAGDRGRGREAGGVAPEDHLERCWLELVV